MHKLPDPYHEARTCIMGRHGIDQHTDVYVVSCHNVQWRSHQGVEGGRSTRLSFCSAGIPAHGGVSVDRSQDRPCGRVGVGGERRSGAAVPRHRRQGGPYRDRRCSAIRDAAASPLIRCRCFGGSSRALRKMDKYGLLFPYEVTWAFVSSVSCNVTSFFL
jgi:hypothetical protein